MTESNGSVLLATDGSELATRAIERGLRVLPPAARVLLVTVVPEPDPSLVVGAGHSGPTMTPDEYERLLETRERRAGEVLDAAAAAIPAVDVEPAVLYGDPGRAICEYAEERGADVIVVGTRGQGGLRRAVLGSVSDHVVRNAPCPVLTVGDA